MSAAAVRLSAGWQPGARPAPLREHTAVHGPFRAGAWQRRADQISQVAVAGLTGRGGGAFPAGTKMQSDAAGRRPAVVMASGTDSEPASRKAHLLLARAPYRVLDGIAAARAASATQARVCWPAGRDRLAGRLLTALGERRQAGVTRMTASALTAVAADAKLPDHLTALARRAVSACPTLALRLERIRPGTQAGRAGR